MEKLLCLICTFCYAASLSAQPGCINNLDKLKEEVILLEKSLAAREVNDTNTVRRIRNIQTWRTKDAIEFKQNNSQSLVSDNNTGRRFELTNVSAQERNARQRKRIYFTLAFPFVRNGFLSLDGRSFFTDYVFDIESCDIAAVYNYSNFKEGLFPQKAGETYFFDIEKHDTN